MQNDILIKTADIDTVIAEFRYYVTNGQITLDDLTELFRGLPTPVLEDIDTAISYALVHKQQQD